MGRVLVSVQTSKYISLSFQSIEIIFSQMTIVLNFNQYCIFSVLNSTLV